MNIESKFFEENAIKIEAEVKKWLTSHMGEIEIISTCQSESRPIDAEGLSSRPIINLTVFYKFI